jgi:general secretion pathway protein G
MSILPDSCRGGCPQPQNTGCNVTLLRVRTRATTQAFTIIELLVVIAIIIVLAGLILSTVGYVQKKGARSRAEAEIAAMSAALESYKADNGIYPRDTTNQYTDTLNARSDTDSSKPVYQNASFFLFTQLRGLNPDQTPIPGAKNYFTFKPQMLGGTRDANGNVNPVTYIRDPFGNSYGYSTAYQKDPATGYNPTFDLWSTANSTDSNQWIKNW